MSRTEQLEREAEATRERVTGNLDEPRASLTPGQVLHQISDYTQIAARDFAPNLRDQATAHPSAALMIGAGAAWMMLRGRTPGDGRGATRGSRQTGASMTEQMAASGNPAEGTGAEMSSQERSGIS